MHQAVQHWTSEDRNRISQQLTGVLKHIRILLIDSKVFAEEVEPTGIVPIELSLERYRLAALSTGSKQTINGRLQPRILCSKMFANSKLLVNDTAKLETTLNEWLGVPKQNWKLLFRASEHGFSSKAFHKHCDGVEPTYVLVLGTKGYLSGGYSHQAWTSGINGSGRFKACSKAFLFRLQCPDRNVSCPVRYEIKKKIFAYGHHETWGPEFGGGSDLLIANSCHLNEDSHSNFPHSYDGEDASSTSLFGSYHFTVVEYEVFTPDCK